MDQTHTTAAMPWSHFQGHAPIAGLYRMEFVLQLIEKFQQLTD